ncbi:hypothetical protein [Cytobacillus oceanisediminis]|uniref:ABC-2 type transport system permease protein n=1 Tax=Cytobacillus oceanisediminis TaxID=665099 RepID=A0A562K672_9BACI|nr:hypothetical protein [Cytobacillus oceanisediminis]TWH90922.1 hypothetical protein IQ19_00372 [Cytobacillus oceanisediminis]
MAVVILLFQYVMNYEIGPLPLIESMMDVTLFGDGWSDIMLPISLMLLITVLYMGIGINLGERDRR